MTVLLVIAAFGVGLLLGMALTRRQQGVGSAGGAIAPPPVAALEPEPEPELAIIDPDPDLTALDEVDLMVDDISVVADTPVDDGLTDVETGLLNDKFFSVTLEARISAARRHLRPVAVVVLEVVEGIHDGRPRPADPPTIAAAIEKTLREADTACRLNDGRFGLVLEDTPETGAVWTVERLRRNLAPDNPGFTMWAGVACYPAHAFSADEILDRAASALEAAKEWRQDRIEVATAAD